MLNAEEVWRPEKLLLSDYDYEIRYTLTLSEE